MRTFKTAVVALTLFAGPMSAYAAGGSSARPAERPSPIIELREPVISAKTAGVIQTAEKECQCSKWKITYEKVCIAWDDKGKCTNSKTVQKEECVEWDHCHDKA